MRVTLQISPEAARKLHRGEHSTPATREIAEAASGMGVSLEPMHPGVEDAELAQYFTVQVPDTTTAEEVINRLRSCEAVEAAYLKPPETMP